MLLLESDWQFQIPHQQSQKYKKPAVKCQTSPFSGGSLGTRLDSQLVFVWDKSKDTYWDKALKDDN